MKYNVPAPLVKLTKIIFFIYVGLFTLIWLLSAPIIKHYAKEGLTPLGLEIADESTIRYNPFTSHISVRGLAVVSSKTPSQVGLSIKSLDVEIRLFSLFFKSLHVSEFTLDGLYLHSDLQKNSTVIAGVSLPLSEGEKLSDNAKPETKTATSESSKNSETADKGNTADVNDVSVTSNDDNASANSFTVVVPTFTIKNSLFYTLINESRQQFYIEDLTISTLEASPIKQVLTLALNSKINQSAFTINSSIALLNGEGRVDVDVALSALALNDFEGVLPENISDLQGKVSYQSRHSIDLNQSNIVINNNDIALTTSDLSVNVGEQIIQLNEQTLTSGLIALSVPKQENGDEALHVKGDLFLELEKLTVFAESASAHIVAFDKFTTGKLAIDTDDNVGPWVSWDKIALQKAHFSDDVSNDIPALSSINELSINQGKASAQGVAIGHVDLNGVKVNAHIDVNKVMLNLVQMAKEHANSSNMAVTPQAGQIAPEQAQEREQETEIKASQESTQETDIEVNNASSAKVVASGETETETQATQPAFHVSVNKIQAADDIVIHFIDESVKPAFEQSVVINTLTVGPIDNQAPNVATPYTIKGRSNEYTKIDFSGEVLPFLTTPSYGIRGKLSEFDLPPVSSYIKSALAYEIQSGQLDVELDAKLTGTILEGDTTILLRGIDLKSADAHEAGNLMDQTSVPFNVALGMLKDSDGNVSLDLSLDGDTSSPTFGVSGFLTLLIKKATMMAAKDYLVTTFVPYANIVSIAMAAGEYALKVRINDLVYTPKQLELSEQQNVLLQELAALFKDKPDLQVKLCPVATPEDINKKVTTKITTESDIDTLMNLSRKRVALFKSQLVEKYKVNSAQLLTCTPQISVADDAKPAIRFVN